MRPHFVVVSLFGALLLAACNSVSSAGPTGPFTLSVPDPWPGSTVYVSSPDFRRGVTSATLRVDTFTVQLTPSGLNDSTLSGTLPANVSGEVATELTVAGVRFQTRPLQIAGYLDTRIVPPGSQSFIGATFAFPQGGEAQLVGSDLGGDLTILNLDRASYRTIARHSTSALRYAGPGSTYLPGVFLFRRVTGALESWDLNGAGTNLGTHPDVPFANNDFLSLTTRLGPNAWLLGDEGDYHYFIRKPDAGGTFSIEYSGGAYYGVQFSPRGDRAVGLGKTAIAEGATLPPLSQPVYALPSASVAFLLRIGRIGALAFSSDGATLIAAGSESPFYENTRLQFVDATTVAVRADTTLGGSVVAIAADPRRPLIYAALVNGSGPPTILVYSATTFRLLYRLIVPELPINALPLRGESAAIAFNPTGGMYLYIGNDGGGGAHIYRFALPSVK